MPSLPGLLRTSSRPLTAALVIVTGVGPIATDSYVAALPALQVSLHTSAAVAQLTLTAFIIGMAGGQIVFGPVSDGLGRRGLLLGGAVVFTLAAALCAVAPSGPFLVAARLVQGLAAGSGIAIGRAVVGDAYPPAEAAQRYGTLASITFLGPVLAPAAGGLVLAVGDWRALFAVLTGFGVLMVLATMFGLPETLPVTQRHGGGLGATVHRMRDLAGDWSFMRHVAVQCLVVCGFFTYIGGSSFVLQEVYGISEGTYALVFAVNAVAMAVTSMLFRLTVGRVGAVRLRLTGMIASSVAVAGVLVCALAEHQGPGTPPLAVVWVLLTVLVGGMGLTIPSATTLAQEAGRRSRGTAAALQGGLSFACGALVTPLTGLLGFGTLLPMAGLMSGFFALAMLLLALLRGAADAGVASSTSRRTMRETSGYPHSRDHG
ncbi:multidrug effflux MFS transporter [Kineosporia sp. J2-2]|uniref:Multidrug effflux MFS transporter n=1 Tax=Kineosporia corallincola TaxID=2835133 RepID=A0ABS5TPL8_9ACTN|nr:multidrug effflux MFS transporter [Kineosporia corallincola]MBT0772136.1 multidrug effflux MFS transporter [Kineosporia corallincola]